MEAVKEPLKMTYIIKTETSSLSICDISDEKFILLLRECQAYVEPLLIVEPPIFIFQKECKQHRNIGFFSDTSVGYYYSKQLASSQPLGPLEGLLCQINEIFHTDFNGILVNLYKDGNDYIGAHSDDEKYLSSAGVVAISLGVSRKFRIKDKVTKKTIVDVKTGDCQILHMSPNFQKEYMHEIPKEKKVTKPRLSFTFRHHRE